MKQVKRRTLLVLLLILGLFAGIVFFCVEYTTKGGAWASFTANDSTHTDGRLNMGQILDRNGKVLYDAETGEYAADWITRISTLHAVGDGSGFIGTSARSAFADRLVGFDPVFGTTGGGNKLYLTIDADLNETAYGLLSGYKGVVAVYNYQTGEVLCMVSAPAYDPLYPPTDVDNDPAYDGVYMNRFLSSTFPPGSVFKVVTTAAALEKLNGILDRTFVCEGEYRIGDDVITCPHVHGEMDLYGAFANSCNCVYAQLAMELGGETLEKYAEEAGLLDAIAVSGLATAEGNFTIGESYELGWSGVGQFHDMVNPCTMLTLMGSIAKEGAPALPRLIHKERSVNGIPHLVPGRKLGDATFDKKTCQTLKEMMANNVAVTYGQSNFSDLKICAKSGTAEVESGAQPHAWFAGFLDDAEHPLAFVVLVENGGSGASVAGNIASQVLQQAVSKMGE